MLSTHQSLWTSPSPRRRGGSTASSRPGRRSSRSGRASPPGPGGQQAPGSQSVAAARGAARAGGGGGGPVHRARPRPSGPRKSSELRRRDVRPGIGGGLEEEAGNACVSSTVTCRCCSRPIAFPAVPTPRPRSPPWACQAARASSRVLGGRPRGGPGADGRGGGPGAGLARRRSRLHRSRPRLLPRGRRRPASKALPSLEPNSRALIWASSLAASLTTMLWSSAIRRLSSALPFMSRMPYTSLKDAAPPPASAPASTGLVLHASPNRCTETRVSEWTLWGLALETGTCRWGWGRACHGNHELNDPETPLLRPVTPVVSHSRPGDTLHSLHCQKRTWGWGGAGGGRVGARRGGRLLGRTAVGRRRNRRRRRSVPRPGFLPASAAVFPERRESPPPAPPPLRRAAGRGGPGRGARRTGRPGSACLDGRLPHPGV